MIKAKKRFLFFNEMLKKSIGKISAGIPSIKVHPLFVGYAALLIFSGAFRLLAVTVLAVIVHEMGHSAEAMRHGYRLEKITVMPYGAVIDGEKISPEHIAVISVAGPAANVLFALVCFVVKLAVALPILTDLINANIAIFAFNLLPAYPLDGARIVLTFFKNKIKALKVLRYVGISCALVLFSLFIVSAFGQINFSLGIISVFLFAGSVTGTDGEIFRHVAGLSPLNKDYKSGVEMRRVAVQDSTPIARLSGMLKSSAVTSFVVVNSSAEVLAEFDEDDVYGIIMRFPADAPLGEVVNSLKTT